jgi:hypothetical protein
MEHPFAEAEITQPTPVGLSVILNCANQTFEVYALGANTYIIRRETIRLALHRSGVSCDRSIEPPVVGQLVQDN